MTRLLALGLGILASIALYLAVFSAIERPLTLGDLDRQLQYKLARAAQLPSPKLLIVAGSNGRYSHRCDALSEAIGRPCVNGAIAAGIGLDFLLDQYATVLRRGDIVYMPLEYEQYAATEDDMHLGVQNAVLLRQRPEYLRSQPLERRIETLAAFDLPFLIRGVVEMALARTSFKRRSGLDTLTPEGDERGHTADRGEPYRAFLRQATLPRTAVPERSYAQTVLRGFLLKAAAQGITVVGGLPTVPQGTPLDDRDVARIRALFVGASQRFVSAENRSMYAIDCFYDAPYHLHEACQVQHSRRIGSLIAAELARPGPSR
jgi:hypothetical protein